MPLVEDHLGREVLGVPHSVYVFSLSAFAVEVDHLDVPVGVGGAALLLFTDTTLADVGGGFAGGRPIGQQQLMVCALLARAAANFPGVKRRRSSSAPATARELEAENRAESVG